MTLRLHHCGMHEPRLAARWMKLARALLLSRDVRSLPELLLAARIHCIWCCRQLTLLGGRTGNLACRPSAHFLYKALCSCSQRLPDGGGQRAAPDRIAAEGGAPRAHRGVHRGGLTHS